MWRSEGLDWVERCHLDRLGLWCTYHPAQVTRQAFLARCRRLEAVDPLFAFNLHPHPSRGKACRAGRTVVSVDGDGTVRRCHFIPDVLGNLYEEGFESRLTGRPCTNATCGCHIGYVHLHELDLYSVFGDGVLERIPVGSAPIAFR